MPEGHQCKPGNCLPPCKARDQLLGERTVAGHSLYERRGHRGIESSGSLYWKRRTPAPKSSCRGFVLAVDCSSRCFDNLFVYCLRLWLLTSGLIVWFPKAPRFVARSEERRVGKEGRSRG